MRVVQELRQATRALMRQPGLSLLAIIALGVGIGLPTAMFSLVQGALLRGLPFEGANRIYHLERRRIGDHGEGPGAHARDITIWQARQHAFEQLAATRSNTVTVRAGNSSMRENAAFITPNLFALLRVQALHGRALKPGDEVAAEAPLVLGHDIWRDRFASDPGAIGRTVYIEGQPHTVVGVMPPRFRFPDESQLWLPVAIDARAVADPNSPTYDVIGRLNSGSSINAARAEFAVIGAEVARQYPETNRNLEVAVKRLSERLFGEVATQTMYVMLGVVLLVLLVACINVANLLLVRAVYRTREIAIRAALGAGRGRIVRQLLLEALVLSVLGGALGIVVAILSNAGLAQGAAGRLPSWVEIRIDGFVLTFAILLTVLSAVIAAVLPAIKSTRGDLASTLYDASRGSTGLRVGRVMRVLVVAEVALSFALIALTALMVRGVRNVQEVPLAFAPERVFTAEVSLPGSYDASARLRYFDALQRALAAAPGASAVTLTTAVPTARADIRSVMLEGQTYATGEGRPRTRSVVITPEFFPTFGAKVLRGRTFGAEDRADSEPVAIVNERFAQQLLHGKDALGQRISFDAKGPWLRIVGVVPDLWTGGLDAPTTDRNPAAVYQPVSQVAPSSLVIAARTRSGNPLELSDAVRDIAFRLNPDVPIYNVRSMPQVIIDGSWFYGWGAGIVGVCGLCALLLATIGLFGVVAFSVGRRIREFGIRLAVGAAPSQVILLVLRQSAAQVLIGLGLGIALALVLGRGVSSLMFMVSPSDPVVITLVAATLTTIALLAAYTPARRAARIDPLSALREE